MLPSSVDSTGVSDSASSIYQDPLILILLVLLLVGGIVIIFVPPYMTRKVYKRMVRIELTNKIRITFSQVLGGIILVGTLWANIDDSRATRENYKEERKLSRELAAKNDSLLRLQLKIQMFIDSSNRVLLREEFKQRKFEFEQSITKSDSDRIVLNKQIKAQRDASLNQKNVQLYSQGSELLASKEVIKQLSGIETLYNLATTDKSYFDLSMEIFERTLKTTKIKGEAKLLMFERLIDIHRTEYLTYLGDLDLSNMDISFVDLSGYVIHNCNLQNTRLHGRFINTQFINCDIKGSYINGTDPFFMADCYRIDTAKVILNFPEPFSNAVNSSIYGANELISWKRSNYQRYIDALNPDFVFPDSAGQSIVRSEFTGVFDGFDEDDLFANLRVKIGSGESYGDIFSGVIMTKLLLKYNSTDINLSDTAKLKPIFVRTGIFAQ